MRRRFFTILLSFCLLLPTLPAFAAEPAKEDVQTQIDAYYTAVQAAGTPHWNAGQSEKTVKRYADEEQYAKSVTGRPCPHGVCRSNSFGNAVQCFGFAKYMCYVLYGSYPQYAQLSTFSGKGGLRDDGWSYFKRSSAAYPGLKVGDMLRWYAPNGNIHGAVVYSVNGGSITLFDCNNLTVGAGCCQIRKSPLNESTFKRYYNAGQAYICRNTGNMTTWKLSFSTGTAEPIPPQTQTSQMWKKIFVIPEAPLSQEGCTFLGWSESPGGEARWHAGDTLGLRKSTTLYAVWKVNDPSTNSYFVDVTVGSWYEQAIRFVTENRLMVSCGEGQFCPQKPLTRAQLAQILYNRENKPAVTGYPEFTDVERDTWYTDAINWAAGSGLVFGYGDGRFGPNAPITREQLVATLYRYAEQKGAIRANPGSPKAFLDENDVSIYAREAIDWAVAGGLLVGRGGKLVPQGIATRAEAAAVFTRFAGFLDSLQ